ncbi:non-ribosomal peptide synthetase [Eleftheria terrae]|uniref:non-ribosomal peptide synthetase n=1 Tax=Eleftheria terrae TaxID=1597781 RepID=UPI00263B9D31|nr:non-ribosomal peptide synthetase [Eleftheria terrae]WKB50625.1 non-ribosomal peptide synthetase [Eleftheria terrae]
MDTVVSRFLGIAQAHPARPALVSDAETLGYGELHRHAAGVAHAVHQWFQAEKGRPVQPTDVIGIRIEKCADLYIAIVGVLLAGASYVPLDPELAPDTQRYIMERCACPLVLTLGTSCGLPEGCAGLAVERSRPGTGPEPAVVPPPATIPTDICYTIFTSGSTGKPKGVAVHHANLLNLVDWAVQAFGMSPTTRVLQYSTINFDASILDIFPTLLSGGALCIPTATQRLAAGALAEFCRSTGVDQAFLPPSLLGVLDPLAFRSIGTLLTGGEACSPQVTQAWAPGRHFYNLYGPTECTVLATCRLLDAGASPKNLGRAISGVRTHVLDEEGRPARRGELHIAGLAVSPGYVGDPASTAAKFVRISALDASVLYKTGDIVELDEAGELHFIGRKDRQVKVRGYRIELEEIEGALLSLGCREVAVTLSPKGALVAYVATGEPLDAQALKAALEQRLSSFKVPQHIVALPRLPHKSNGKVDHALLPAHEPAAATHPGRGPADALDARHAPIAELWAQALGVDAAALHLQSNFRELGGSSIDIVHLLSAVESRFGASVSFIDFFKQPTIEFLFHSLSESQDTPC